MSSNGEGKSDQQATALISPQEQTDEISSASSCFPVDLTICLLCSGRGSDAQSYRPNLDESQWWGRRDALVRCVAASLYGPTSALNTRTELCLLFDEDGCIMRMGSPPLGQSGGILPTEKNIVSAWRSAATHADTNTSSNSSMTNNAYGSSMSLAGRRPPEGVKCIKEPWQYATASSEPDEASINKETKIETSATGPSAADINFDVSRLQSKRDVLLHIQQRCPLSFLRKHRLNSSVDAILRKTNKAKLVKAWEEWVGSSAVVGAGQKRKRRVSSSTHHDKKDEDKRIELTFRSILLDLLGGSSSSGHRGKHESTVESCSDPRVIAAVLHESCDSELPCWFEPTATTTSVEHEQGTDKSSGPLRLCLFLGAVRDMTDNENHALKSVCNDLSIPLLGFRLGPVPEFTSKILSVVSYHNSRGVLGPAALRLWQKKQGGNNPVVGAVEPSIKRRGRRRMHVLCSVPICSDELTSDISARSRTLWCLVRVCVCTLWRSKLASASTSSSVAATGKGVALENTLSLMFDDGLIVTIEQEDLVKSLAEKHQAAPSEKQILVALCQKREDAFAANQSYGVATDAFQQFIMESVEKWKTIDCCNDELNDSDSDLPEPFCCCLQVSLAKGQSKNRKKSFTDRVYSKRTSRSTGGIGDALVFVHMQLRRNMASPIQDETILRQNAAIVSAFRNNSIPILEENISTNTQDAEASTVSMLQHFEYQGRLMPALKLLLDAREHAPMSFEKKRSSREKVKQKRRERKEKKGERVKKKSSKKRTKKGRATGSDTD